MLLGGGGGVGGACSYGTSPIPEVEVEDVNSLTHSSTKASDRSSRWHKNGMWSGHLGQEYIATLQHKIITLGDLGLQ